MVPEEQKVPLAAQKRKYPVQVEEAERAAKQRAITEEEEEELALREKETVLERGRHPYGVEPWGSFYSEEAPQDIRSTSLGSLAPLDDSVVLEIVSNLSARQVCRLAVVSRACYVFGHHDELWRNLVLEQFGGKFRFKTSWKDTYAFGVAGATYSRHLPLKVKGFYSDLLFQPWLCSTLGVLPEWLQVSNIDRRNNLSLKDFVEEYEKKNRPVIITDVVNQWPAFKKWSPDYLRKNFGDVVFAAGPVDMTLNDFYSYCQEVQEEKPLYLFDKHFASNCPSMALDYEVPAYFNQDLLALMPQEERPDYRWVIIGPGRSGSSFHVDPNCTSAWNAVISGRKKWIMFPPGNPPPGVIPSADMSEVTSSASMGEWFLNFYPETKTCKVKPLECVCEAGEMIFVPNGWWHCVLNLEPSIAITQNYVSERNLLQCLTYLEHKPNCISGMPLARRHTLLPNFLEALQAHRPGLVDDVREKGNAKKLSQSSESFWAEVVLSSEGGSGSSNNDAGTFSFGF